MFNVRLSLYIQARNRAHVRILNTYYAEYEVVRDVRLRRVCVSFFFFAGQTKVNIRI